MRAHTTRTVRMTEAGLRLREASKMRKPALRGESGLLMLRREKLSLLLPNRLSLLLLLERLLLLLLLLVKLALDVCLLLLLCRDLG